MPMKFAPHPILAALALLVAAPTARLFAQALPPPLLRAPEAAAAAVNAEAEADLRGLVERVQARLQNGQATAAQLAEELKTFDALAEKYGKSRPDAAAEILVMKALLYVQVFDEPEQALPIFKKIAADFPRTEVGAQMPALVAELERIVAIKQATAIGREFPVFKEAGFDGEVVDLAAYRGKVVLVAFWATWCGPCMMELPNLQAAHGKHHAEGFEIIGINLDQDRERLAAFLKARKLPWPQLFDGRAWEGKLPQAYGVRALPASFLLDRQGKIVAKDLRGTALMQKVAELVAQKP